MQEERGAGEQLTVNKKKRALFFSVLRSKCYGIKKIKGIWARLLSQFDHDDLNAASAHPIPAQPLMDNQAEWSHTLSI